MSEQEQVCIRMHQDASGHCGWALDCMRSSGNKQVRGQWRRCRGWISKEGQGAETVRDWASRWHVESRSSRGVGVVLEESEGWEGSAARRLPAKRVRGRREVPERGSAQNMSETAGRGAGGTSVSQSGARCSDLLEPSFVQRSLDGARKDGGAGDVLVMGSGCLRSVGGSRCRRCP
eukprot:2186460-Pleurochrysis_carterae.AAC.2